MSQVALGMRIWSLVAYQSSHKEAWRRAEPGGKPTGKPIPQRHASPAAVPRPGEGRRRRERAKRGFLLYTRNRKNNNLNFTAAV